MSTIFKLLIGFVLGIGFCFYLETLPISTISFFKCYKLNNDEMIFNPRLYGKFNSHEKYIPLIGGDINSLSIILDKILNDLSEIKCEPED